MPVNPIGPRTPAATPTPQALDDTERTLPGRRLGVVLALVALGPLPFIQVTSCNGGPAVTSSGLEMFTATPELAIWTPFLLSAILGLAWLAVRVARPGRRLMIGVLEWLAVAGLFVVSQVALISAGLFDTVESLPASFVAALLLICLVLDATVTLVYRAWILVQSIRRARNHSRHLAMAGSSGEIT
jgi:hypothetical protein